MQLQRGFHRIGLVGLVPLCVLSLLFFAYALYSWLAAPPYGGLGLPRDDEANMSGALGIAALVLGGLWYLASWAIGWIVAGFRD